MTLKAALPAAALLLLSACGGGSQAENTADRLEEAAEQSDPAAAQVLQNAADEVSAGNMSADQAMQAAGNAQAATVGEQTPPPSMQAQPNRTGQQTPPPKVPTGPGSPGAAQGNSQ